MDMRRSLFPDFPWFVWDSATDVWVIKRKLKNVAKVRDNGMKYLKRNSKSATVCLPAFELINENHWQVLWPSLSVSLLISNKCGVFNRTETNHTSATLMRTRRLVQVLLYVVGLATANHLSRARNATVYTETMPSVKTRYCENKTRQKISPWTPPGTGRASTAMIYPGVMAILIPEAGKKHLYSGVLVETWLDI